MAGVPVLVPALFAANGTSPASGAKLYAYIKGTSTPQTFYTDEAITTPAANPTVANSLGATVRYLDPSKNYDLVAKTSDEATTLFSVTYNVDANNITLGTGWEDVLELPAAGILDNLNGIRSVATYAALTALTTATGLSDNGIYYTYARTTEEDGGAGFWRYDSASTATANGGTILAIDGGGAGRFFCLSSILTRRKTWKANNLLFDLAGSSQATLLDFTTGADVTVAASKQADLIYFADTFDIGSAGIVHLMNANVTAKSTSHSSSNLRGPTITITNNGPGTTTGIYPRAIAGVGCTGNILAVKSGVQTISGIASAYSRQITNDTDTSGTVDALDWWTSNTASATTANYGLLADTKLSIATSFIQYSSVGAGAFVTQKNATNSADLFRISAAGVIAECKGLTLNGASTINTQMSFSAQVPLSLSNGTREWQWQAVTSGDYTRLTAGGIGDVVLFRNDFDMEPQGDVTMATGKRIDLQNSQATVGAAGGASALPATPTGYIPIKVGGTEYVVPYYAKT